MRKTIIRAKTGIIGLDLPELIRFKDLFYTLAWRDFRVRYAQTLIGFLWAFIQPLLTIAILSLIFGRFINVNTGNVPHLLFTVCGVSAWTYFSYVLTNSGNSIISAQAMVKKVYFPRLIIPLSKAVVGLIDFGITLLFIVILMIYYGITPSINVVFMPVFILLTIIASLGVGIWLSALTIRYRDFQHIIPFVIQIGLYVTPTAYPAEYAIQKLPKAMAFLYFLNPMAGIIQGFRWSILGAAPPDFHFALSIAASIVLFVSGLWYFKQVEGEMADIL